MITERVLLQAVPEPRQNIILLSCDGPIQVGHHIASTLIVLITFFITRHTPSNSLRQTIIHMVHSATYEPVIVTSIPSLILQLNIELRPSNTCFLRLRLALLQTNHHSTSTTGRPFPSQPSPFVFQWSLLESTTTTRLRVAYPEPTIAPRL